MSTQAVVIGDAERNGSLTHHTHSPHVIWACLLCWQTWIPCLTLLDPALATIFLVVSFHDVLHSWLEAALVCTDHHKEGCLIRGNACAVILCCCAGCLPFDFLSIVLRAAPCAPRSPTPLRVQRSSNSNPPPFFFNFTQALTSDRLWR